MFTSISNDVIAGGLRTLAAIYSYDEAGWNLVTEIFD